MRTKGVIAGIFVLFAAAAAVYLMYPSVKALFEKKHSLTPSAMVQYSNDAYGISFAHPDSYGLEGRDMTINGEVVHLLTLTPKGVTIPEYGEGSTAITLSIFELSKKTSLEDWVHSMTNTYPKPQGGFSYTERVVDGTRGVSYTSTGLYESDNIALMRGNRIYVFSVSWLTRNDIILKDFDTVLASVSFTK